MVGKKREKKNRREGRGRKKIKAFALGWILKKPEEAVIGEGEEGNVKKCGGGKKRKRDNGRRY